MNKKFFWAMAAIMLSFLLVLIGCDTNTPDTNGGSYNIYGIITLSGGSGDVTTASVSLVNADYSAVGTPVTPKTDGAYSISGVKAGVYVVSVYLEGYTPLLIDVEVINEDIDIGDKLLETETVNPPDVPKSINVSGTPTVGSQLTATASFTVLSSGFSWYRSNSGTPNVAADTALVGIGTNKAKYTLTSADAGKYIYAYASETASNVKGAIANRSVETKEWVADGNGFTQYYTNDSANINKFKWGRSAHSGSAYEVECKKMSGYEGAGYGMLFSLSDSGFCGVGISADGYYLVFKTGSGSNLEDIQDWQKITDTCNFQTGYDKSNKIKVVKSSSENPNYNVYINNSFVFSFNNSDYSGTEIGVFVSTADSNYESFPNIPVDVRFKIIN